MLEDIQVKSDTVLEIQYRDIIKCSIFNAFFWFRQQIAQKQQLFMS